MTPQPWRDVDAVLSAALDLPESEQDAWVTRECEGRPDLRAEVESFLRAHRAAATFLDPAGNEGRRVGPYRLLECIGVGGMGAVYRAAREDHQFRQEVAVKLMGAALELRPEVVRRFLDERQILAGLAHPNIARLLDGGYVEDGTPYIVMEYVAGTPITTYCEEFGLHLRARLELFRKLGEGVQYAHQHLVIHRDIKPANILVTGEGVPKLLDFGIAKLLDKPADCKTTTVLALTPDYASPEQISGGVMSTASDIYSLGVLLYELVARQRPYRVAGHPLQQAIACICTQDPPPPSSVFRGLPEDIDAIVRKAMRKEPELRYGSVRELSDDIERFLLLRPVLARQGAHRYFARKFVRRNRAGVAIGAAMAVLLAGSAAAVIRENHIALQERDRAQRRFNEVRQLAHSVIFDLHDKIAGLPGSTPVRKDLIATAIGYLDRLANETAGDGALQRELAEAYLRIGDVQGGGNENLGDSQGALRSFQQAEHIARASVLAEPSFESRKLLAEALRKPSISMLGRNRAEAYRKEALAISRELRTQYPKNEDATLLLANCLFGMANLSDDSQSLAYKLEALPLFEAMLSAKPSDLVRQRNAALIHKYIAGSLVGREPDRSLPYLQRAMDLDEARLANSPGIPEVKLDLSFDYSQFGEYYEQKRDLPKALLYNRKMLVIRRAVAAADPKDAWKQDRLAWALASNAHLQVLSGNIRAALAGLEEAQAMVERLMVRDRSEMHTYARIIGQIGEVRRKMGNEEAACVAYSKVREVYRILALEGNLGSEEHVDQEIASCPGSQQ